MALRAAGHACGFYNVFVHALGFIYVGDDDPSLTNELPHVGTGSSRLHDLGTDAGLQQRRSAAGRAR